MEAATLWLSVDTRNRRMDPNGSRSTTLHLAHSRKTLRCGPMTTIAVSLESLPMRELIRTYLSGIRASYGTLGIQFMATALSIACDLSVAPISWSEQHTALTLKTAIILSQPPIVDPEAQ